MQRVPPALLASYRALYVIVRGHAAEEQEEINRWASCASKCVVLVAS